MNIGHRRSHVIEHRNPVERGDREVGSDPAPRFRRRLVDRRDVGGALHDQYIHVRTAREHLAGLFVTVMEMVFHIDRHRDPRFRVDGQLPVVDQFIIERLADRKRVLLHKVAAAVDDHRQPPVALRFEVGEKFGDRAAVIHPDHMLRVELQRVPASEHVRHAVFDQRVVEAPVGVVVFEADAAVEQPLRNPVDHLFFPLRVEHGFKSEHIVILLFKEMGQPPDVFVVERRHADRGDRDGTGLAAHQRLRLQIRRVSEPFGHRLDLAAGFRGNPVELFGIQHQRHRRFAFPGQFGHLFQCDAAHVNV